MASEPAYSSTQLLQKNSRHDHVNSPIHVEKLLCTCWDSVDAAAEHLTALITHGRPCAGLMAVKGAHVALHDIMITDVEGERTGLVGEGVAFWAKINARMAKNNPWTSWHGMGDQNMGLNPSLQAEKHLHQNRSYVW